MSEDDSGSMKGPRMDAQRVLVQRMASIATRLVPDNSGAYLRFINKSATGLDNLTKDQIDGEMQFEPDGTTRIGTNLKKKILQPFVYDVIQKGGRLERPYLILIITDGMPKPEDVNTLKNAIIECGRILTDRSYPQEGMREIPHPFFPLLPYTSYVKVLTNPA